MTKVSIGMPVFNNGKTLLRAIESVRSQTHKDWDLIISDDCSHDETESVLDSICDPRIRIFRQSSNLYYMNFKFVLDRASNPYFCWLAGDDYWCEDFLEKTEAHLNCVESCVLVSPKVVFVDFDGTIVGISSGTHDVKGEVFERLAVYLRDPSDNSRMYGLFRTEVANKSMPSKCFHAWDWSLCARSLLYGDHHEVAATTIYRDKTPSAAYVNSIDRDEHSVLTRYFPVYRCTKDILENVDRNSWAIMRSMLRLNIRKNREYVAIKNPFVYKMLNPIYRQLLKSE